MSADPGAPDRREPDRREPDRDEPDRDMPARDIRDRPIPAHDGTDLVGRTWPSVGAPLVLVPLGATEQHGPHLPLDVDATIAAAVAQGLAKRSIENGTDAVVAPTIAYGSSGEHQDFPGTLSIGTAALQLMLVELGRSATVWAPRVVFVNGHGGNLDGLSAAVRILRSEGREVAWLPSSPDDGAPHDAHAGFDETAMLMHLRAAAVRADSIEPGATAAIGELLPRLRAEGVRAVSPNGVLGDPRGATAEAGERLLDTIIDAAWYRLIGEVTGDGRLVARSARRSDRGTDV
jgi:creatinine amidohydrolase